MFDNIRGLPPWRPTRPWSAWKAERDALLHRFVNEQLYPYSRFYRRMFDECKIDPRSIRTLADLRRLPFTTKHDIAPTPESVRVPASLVDTMTKLYRLTSGAVAFISGRQLAAIDALFAPLKLPTVGCHGAEIRTSAEGDVLNGPELPDSVRHR